MEEYNKFYSAAHARDITEANNLRYVLYAEVDGKIKDAIERGYFSVRFEYSKLECLKDKSPAIVENVEQYLSELIYDLRTLGYNAYADHAAFSTIFVSISW